MTISEFLGCAARSIDAGIPVQGSLAPKGWGAYVGLTLPQDSDHASPEEFVSTRVLRFLLAQAIAKSDENEAFFPAKVHEMAFSYVSNPKSWGGSK